MAEFVFFAGGHTGSWVWEEVVARLWDRGHRAFPVEPSFSADAGLESHIDAVLRVLDEQVRGKAVLVGHCYGIFPVLGAVDRRASRVERTVYLEATVPVDGESALSAAPRAVADRIRSTAANGLIPAPPGDDPAWGLAGLSPSQREEFLSRVLPQPLRTFTDPLRLTSPPPGPPTTGIFCTKGLGVTIAAAQSLVDTGDPRFRQLADPRTGFFELDTGHYPMLSAAPQLADTLESAAQGNGQRLTPTSQARSASS